MTNETVPNELFLLKVTVFNKSAQGAIADQDPTALDFSVDVKLGKLRFVFLEYFVAHLQVCGSVL